MTQAAAPHWRRLPDVPTPRSGAAVFASGARVFVVGGQSGPRFLEENDAFDTATGAWSRAASVRLGRTFSATNSAAVDGVLYLMDGNPRGYCTNAADAFDVAKGAWRLLPGAPVARCHAMSVAAAGRVFVIGGWNTSSTVRYTQVDVFDPVSRTWGHAAPLPSPRGGGAGAAIGNVIYLAGGWTPESPASGRVDALDLSTGRWSIRPEMPTARSAAAAAVLNGRLYVMGGLQVVDGKPRFTDAVESYDPATNRWRTEIPLPSPTAYGAAATIGNTLYFIGGANETASPLATVYALTPPAR